MNCCRSSLRLRKVISHTSNCTPRTASCSTRSSYLLPFVSLAPFIRKSTPRACATTMIFAVGLTSRWLLMLRRPFDACATPSLKWYTTLSCGLPPPVAAYAAIATNSAEPPTTTARLLAFMAPPANWLVPRHAVWPVNLRPYYCSMAGESPALLHYADKALLSPEGGALFSEEKKQERILPGSLAAYTAAAACLMS